MNWDYNNPKLKCKKVCFYEGTFFDIGQEYQIYRIMYLPPTEAFIIYVMNEALGAPTPFPFYDNGDEYNAFYHFEGVELLIKQAIRKSKLEDIKFNENWR